MSENKQNGDLGEMDIVNLIPCPNCGKKLMILPPNYPLYDVQCTACSFRAQIKTNNKKPCKEILGAGWDIMNKVLKAGFMIPPLIVNFKWRENLKERQEIIFYPFIPKKYLKHSIRNIKRGDRKYPMFNYTNLDIMPKVTMYKK